MNIEQTVLLGGIEHNLLSFSRRIAEMVGSSFYTNPEINHCCKAITWAILRENIVIPLDRRSLRGNLTYNIKDKKGMREFGFRIIRGSDLAEHMGYPPSSRMRIGVPPNRLVAQMHSNDSPKLEHIEIEEYDAILNVSYLVDEMSLNLWLNGLNTNKIRDKKVEDCNVLELLFAVKQKLKIERC